MCKWAVNDQGCDHATTFRREYIVGSACRRRIHHFQSYGMLNQGSGNRPIWKPELPAGSKQYNLGREFEHQLKILLCKIVKCARCPVVNNPRGAQDNTAVVADLADRDPIFQVTANQ